MQVLNTPWKVWNEIARWMIYPWARFVFALNRVPWGKGWRLHGMPIIQRHRQSRMRIGNGMGLRSAVRSNPLGPNRPVILCTWQAGAVLEIGENFAMTGGTICAAEHIQIGNNVIVGANTTIIDTDFHPLDPVERRLHPAHAKTAPVIIEDDVFIGMNCLILKGVTIGSSSVIGAGSVVTQDVSRNTIVAGNPARLISHLETDSR
jgi:acetyltransferase-like isoleucine patch superfamily enzyme